MTENARLKLLSLPDEILIHILGYLDRPATYKTILLSKHLQALAEPRLYEDLVIKHGRHAFLIARNFHNKPQRTQWVRSLIVSVKLDHADGLEAFPPWVAAMDNLRDMRLETPDCNHTLSEDRVYWIRMQDAYELMFQQASVVIASRAERKLPNLRTCTLHFVDDRKAIYSMTKYSLFFLHPTLQSLTLSCASTDFPDRLLTKFKNNPRLAKSTNLEHLHLEECDIHAASLAILLSFPKELKSFKLSEGVRYETFVGGYNSRTHANIRPLALSEVLADHCAGSLESLSLNLGQFRHSSQDINAPHLRINLTALTKLKYFEVDIKTLTLLRTRPICDHQQWRRLPPSLEVLKVFGISLGHRRPFRAMLAPWIPFSDCVAKEKVQHGLPNLRELCYSYEYDSNSDPSFTSNSIDNDDDDDIINVDDEDKITQVELAKNALIDVYIKMAPIYRTAKVNLRINVKILPSGFIPPYLFYEKSPFEYTLYQSDQVG